MPRSVSNRRVVLGVASLLGALLIVGLALALAKAQRDGRRTVEQRFAYGSAAAASLVHTIVAQAYTNDVALGGSTLGGRTLDAAMLQRAAARTGSRSLVVLDASGRPVAAYPAGARPADTAAAHVREALAGRPAISGVLGHGRAATIEVAVPFPTAGGRRVLVIPSRASQVQKVLGPYLSNLPGLSRHRAYIVDATGRTLADSHPRAAPDVRLAAALRTGPRTGDGAYAGGHGRLSSAAIAGTSWDVVDTAPSSVVYSPVDGWHRTLPWLLLLVLVPAGAFIVVLADRAGRSAQSAGAASEAKSAFLASMSHELRTPMTTVIGFSEMLHQGKLGPLTERQTEIVGHIHTSSKHLNQLVAEVLDLARVEEGRMTFHPEDVQPHLLVAEVADGMGGLAADRGIHIEVDAPDVGTFRLDPARFKQVLYNLIGNGLKFTEAGGRVAVALRRDEHGELAVEVTDSGSGIRPEDLEKIFLPFEQGVHRNGGAGLGLAVSRRIVDAQGGRIGVLSEPGEGATFTVTLPSAP
jgi:nitrogen-specific signal transduction histidine kinase